MSRAFRIDFYPHEWLTQTSHMGAEEKGIFITICMMIYARGEGIRYDRKHLAKACNCNPRLITAAVDKLVAIGDLQLENNPVDGLWIITQKRCMREIKKIRNHLEMSANGGRKKNENERESKQLSMLSSTSIHTPSTTSNNKPPESVTPREEVLKNEKGDFKIRDVITGDGIAMAKKAVPGWDVYALMPKYDEAVKRMGRPERPDHAFAGWCKKFTKGKPPQ